MLTKAPAPQPEAARQVEPRDPAEQALARMELIRAVEERLLALFSEGKLFGTTHTCIGQEVCAVSVVGALDLSRDVVVSNHRGHGHFLMYSDDPDALIAEIMGRQTGVCGGRGGSQHLHVRNFYSNGVLGGMVPVATGIALAEKLKGRDAITVCFLGDGTLGEGVIYEAMNMASLWQLPILYALEYNCYAQSTPTVQALAGDITARAAAFGIAADRRPADDPVALSMHVRAVVEQVRRGKGPFFQILDTYRLAAHSKGDDDRSPEELDVHRRHDPLVRLRWEIGEEQAEFLAGQASRRVDEAVRAADTAPYLSLDPTVEEQRVAAGTRSEDPHAAFARALGDPAPLGVQRLNGALHEIMDAAPDVLVIGQDVRDPYGGAFKVTRGLSTRFPGRVIGTPVSEAGLIGLSTGLSLRGFRPVAEIMFGDFLSLAADQILNHLTKFRWMYNGQVEAPVVIRTPVGGGRGYGPTHSQCIEKMFFGIPGLVIVGMSLRHDPGELLRRAVLQDPRPVLFIEQKTLYPKRLQTEAPVGMVQVWCDAERDALYPTGVWQPSDDKAEITVVAYGAMAEVAEKAILAAFDTHEVLSELVIPSQLTPLRIEPIVESVRRTGRLLVVEEGSVPWGFGAEVVARVAEALGGYPVRTVRVGAYHLPIPNARPAEEQVLPDAGRLVEAMRDLTR